ncbi:uncharacterized protein LOC126555177 [Aphis gossypii]|uniref:uncharacterized protein LOC126555177 n=1 Tax=Aphis gossypii TaxID=80765 RepID=UPI0021598055|nr:uncharacterized protein LOC126555177 [Aphis gossypii]
MVYQGENMLIIESKIQDGCRILLNRNDLLKLQDLEWSIFEIIERKTKIVKPLVIQQINQIASYLKTNTKVETRTLEDMTIRVKSINNICIATHVNDYNFTSQLQLHAAEHIAQRWLDELEKDEGYEKPFSPPSFYTIFNEEILSDISPPSQTSCTDETMDHTARNTILIQTKTMDHTDRNTILIQTKTMDHTVRNTILPTHYPKDDTLFNVLLCKNIFLQFSQE